jgi:hypothetical protein
MSVVAKKERSKVLRSTSAGGETEGVDVFLSEPSSRTEGYKDEYSRVVTRNVEQHVTEICCGEDQNGEAQMCPGNRCRALIDDRNSQC